MFKFREKLLEVTNINWGILKVLIFDVDGTLYSQSKLRKKMIIELLKYYLVRPQKFKELMILYYFRSEREKKAGYDSADLESEQYIWCASKLNIPVEQVKSVVKKWIFQFPNPFLVQCRYPGINSLFNLLKLHQIKTAVYSDYSASEKLKFLGLHANLVVASTDPEINSLKPNSRGLIYILEHMGVKPSECIYIGDREKLDGECAINAGIPFINIKKSDPSKFYDQLIHNFKSYIQIYI